MALLRSEDIPPDGVIRLSKAFERYYSAIEPDATATDAKLLAAFEELEKAKHKAPDSRSLLAIAQQHWHTEFDNMHVLQLSAEKSFRAWLASDNGPAAFKMDPATGREIGLNRIHWDEGKTNFVAGFDDDFVSRNDLTQPGPDAIVNGVMCAVYFREDDFQERLIAVIQNDPSYQQIKKTETAKSRAIREAIAAIWPGSADQIEREPGKQRDNKIINWISANRSMTVSDRLIREWLARHRLKAGT